VSFVGRCRGFRLKCGFTGVCADGWLSIVVVMSSIYIQKVLVCQVVSPAREQMLDWDV
jgi:hypothetical protein